VKKNWFGRGRRNFEIAGWPQKKTRMLCLQPARGEISLIIACRHSFSYNTDGQAVCFIVARTRVTSADARKYKI